MKSARQIARLASGVSLCLFALAPRARAVENVLPPISATAMTDEKTVQPAIVLALEAAIDGLQMPSETDAPFKVVFFGLEKQEAPKAEKTEAEKAKKAAISIEKLAELAGAPADSEVETRDLKEFFAVATTVEDWMNDEEKASAARFAALLEILQTQLKDAQVLVWGEAEKSVAIVGEVEGGIAGVTTLIVET